MKNKKVAATLKTVREDFRFSRASAPEQNNARRYSGPAKPHA